MNDLAALEAVLFVTEQPVPTRELAEVLEIPASRVDEMLGELAEQLAAREAGLVLKSVAGGWRLYSHPDAYPYLERFSRSATARKLSSAAMEALAIVAYRQPISRSQIGEIRGVDSDSAVGTLERLGLIEEKERLNIPGNPAVYRTTDLFLEKMGLGDLSELPPLADHVPPAQFVDTLEESLRPGSE
ncbi:MAG TPA: SMC-Scp complex subunit ScpB [Acidimicrobiia bacterium]|nr:SMC-Scp complex subunit ScpB [Acidimicrobiia bacterium]